MTAAPSRTRTSARAGHHRERALHVGGGNAVVVAVEAHIGGLAGADRLALVGGKGIIRQGQELGLLLCEGLAHRDRTVLGTGPIGGLALTPGRGLGVEVVEIAPLAGGEEAVANIANRSFHAAFLIPPRHRHGTRLEAIMSGEFQQGGMEADGIALALEHGTFQVVVEHDPGQSTPGGEGRLVATQEIGHRASRKKRRKIAAREAQHHDEGHQGAFGLADGELAEMAPVHLGLLARQGLQTQIGLGLRAGPVVGNQMAEVILPAAVAALAHHGVEAAGGELRVLLQGLEHKGQVGVDQRGAVGPLDLGQTGLGEHPVDRAVVHAQLPGNGANLPLLHMEVAQDLRFELRGYRQCRVLLVSGPPLFRAQGPWLCARTGGGRSIASRVGRRRRND